jgi:hypothetical protein
MARLDQKQLQCTTSHKIYQPQVLTELKHNMHFIHLTVISERLCNHDLCKQVHSSAGCATGEKVTTAIAHSKYFLQQKRSLLQQVNKN